MENLRDEHHDQIKYGFSNAFQTYASSDSTSIGSGSDITDEEGRRHSLVHSSPDDGSHGPNKKLKTYLSNTSSGGGGGGGSLSLSKEEEINGFSTPPPSYSGKSTASPVLSSQDSSKSTGSSALPVIAPPLSSAAVNTIDQTFKRKREISFLLGSIPLMENLRNEDHNQIRKIKKYGFSNAFQTYASSASTSIGSGSDITDEEGCRHSLLHSSPDDGGHGPNKKLKTYLSNTSSGGRGGGASLSLSKEEEINGFSTPPPSYSGKSTASPVLSSQDSSKSTGFFALPVIAPPLSSAADRVTWKKDAKFDEDLDLTRVALRLFERPTTKGVFNSLKNHLEPILLTRLKELSEMEVTFEVGLEMSDSISLLKLILSSSNEKLEIVGKKASKGAILLQEGLRLAAEGQELLRLAMKDMPNSE